MIAQPLRVAFTTDERFAPGLRAALYSLLSHMPDETPLDVFIVDGGLKAETRVDLELLASRRGETSLHYLTADARRYDGLYVRHSRTAYLRLSIPELLPGVERILYLDSDVVFERSPLELWVTDIGSHPFMAVQDFTNPFVSSPLGVADWRSLGMRPDLPCMNSGVLLINCSAWKRESISERVVDYLAEHRTRLQDQEGLNAVVNGGWGKLHPRWNLQTNAWPRARAVPVLPPRLATSASELLEDVGIIHFNDFPKPWMPGCRSQLRHRYLYYLRNSMSSNPFRFLSFRARLMAVEGRQKVVRVGKRVARRLWSQ